MSASFVGFKIPARRVGRMRRPGIVDTGRPASNKAPPGVVDRLGPVYPMHYSDFNPGHFDGRGGAAAGRYFWPFRAGGAPVLCWPGTIRIR